MVVSKAGRSRRQVRVAELLRREVSSVLIKKFTGGSMILISDVVVTADLKEARFFVRSFGGVSVDIDELNRFAPRIRASIGSSLDLKYIPKVVFIYDESLDSLNKMSMLLDRCLEDKNLD